MSRGRPLTRLDLLDDGKGVIDRNGVALGARGLQAETLGGGGVDANHFAGGVDQGSPDSGWMLASVWMRSVSCSLDPLRSSPAVIDWLRPVMLPPALLGVPPVPPALPTATTDWPTATCDESAIFAVCQTGRALQLEDRHVVGVVVADDLGVVALPFPMSVTVTLVAR